MVIDFRAEASPAKALSCGLYTIVRKLSCRRLSRCCLHPERYLCTHCSRSPPKSGRRSCRFLASVMDDASAETRIINCVVLLMSSAVYFLSWCKYRHRHACICIYMQCVRSSVVPTCVCRATRFREGNPFLGITATNDTRSSVLDCRQYRPSTALIGVLSPTPLDRLSKSNNAAAKRVPTPNSLPA